MSSVTGFLDGSEGDEDGVNTDGLWDRAKKLGKNIKEYGQEANKQIQKLANIEDWDTVEPKLKKILEDRNNEIDDMIQKKKDECKNLRKAINSKLEKGDNLTKTEIKALKKDVSKCEQSYDNVREWVAYKLDNSKNTVEKYLKDVKKKKDFLKNVDIKTKAAQIVNSRNLRNKSENDDGAPKSAVNNLGI